MEWTFYLRLLGESESDGSLHRRARPKAKSRVHKTKTDNDHPAESETNELRDRAPRGENDPEPAKWSWIGPRSPLMHEDNEAEWILKRLFSKLEESLRRQNDNFQARINEMREDDRGRSLQE